MRVALLSFVIAAIPFLVFADELAVGESAVVDGVRITRLPDEGAELTDEQLQALCNARSRLMADAAVGLVEGYDYEIAVSLKLDGVACTTRVERSTVPEKVN